VSTFFFAKEKEIPLYDKTIELIGPGYRDLHKMMLEIAAASLKENKHRKNGRLIGLDIGSGTGAEAISLMRKIDNLDLIALDVSKAMHDEFRRNATKARIPQERFSMLTSDILAPETSENIKAEAKRAFNDDLPLDIVISGFTLHHLTDSERLDVFNMVHGLLPPGGVFLLGDLFNFADESPWLTENIFTWEVAWFSANLDRAALKAEQAGDTAQGQELRALKKKWVKHYKSENNLGGMTNQLTQLKTAGFSQAGSPFRNWQVGLIAARK